MSLWFSYEPLFGHQVWKGRSPFSCPEEYCSCHFWHTGHFLPKDHWHSYYSAGKNVNGEPQSGSYLVSNSRLFQVLHICLGYKARMNLFFLFICIILKDTSYQAQTLTYLLIPILNGFFSIYFIVSRSPHAHRYTCLHMYRKLPWGKHMPVQITLILINQDEPLVWLSFSLNASDQLCLGNHLLNQGWSWAGLAGFSSLFEKSSLSLSGDIIFCFLNKHFEAQH